MLWSFFEIFHAFDQLNALKTLDVENDDEFLSLTKILVEHNEHFRLTTAWERRVSIIRPPLEYIKNQLKDMKGEQMKKFRHFRIFNPQFVVENWTEDRGRHLITSLNGLRCVLNSL